MPTFSLKLNTQQSDRGFARLKEKAPLAISRALNRAIGSSRTAMTREIAADLGLPAGTVRDQLIVTEAKPTRLVAKMTASGARIPLIKFRHTGRYPSRGRGRGVTVRLPGGRGTYPNAFIARVRAGSGEHEGIFQRVGKGRTPIYQLYGPSLPHVFRKFHDVGIARGEEALLTNLEHEFAFAMREAASA